MKQSLSWAEFQPLSMGTHPPDEGDPPGAQQPQKISTEKSPGATLGSPKIQVLCR